MSTENTSTENMWSVWQIQVGFVDSSGHLDENLGKINVLARDFNEAIAMTRPRLKKNECIRGCYKLIDIEVNCPPLITNLF